MLILIIILCIVGVACHQSIDSNVVESVHTATVRDTSISASQIKNYGTGPLLSTKFKSLDELKSLITIQYVGDTIAKEPKNQKAEVQLTYEVGEHKVISNLKSGINEGDFGKARSGKFVDRVKLGFLCPFVVWHKSDLMSIEYLGRKRPTMFGKGDIAFYDVAVAMVGNIVQEDRAWIPAEDMTEKGYQNTFNHVTAQVFMTSVFSEEIADFVADVHERQNLPEMITGHFTPHQLSDLVEGPVDNYVDMLNNEFGQELGKTLKQKYAIERKTWWTPELMADYLNDIQSYYCWTMRIGFHPFRESDALVIRFAEKMNVFRNGAPKLTRAW